MREPTVHGEFFTGFRFQFLLTFTVENGSHGPHPDLSRRFRGVLALDDGEVDVNLTP